ncbi:MAG: UvrD-helicase domain-containing protein [Bacteroidota bacterium]|nr:UvrD-helicase domain-containing protein [Bacteroidota bacterium]
MAYFPRGELVAALMNNAEHILKDLNDKQREAVLSVNGPLLAVAGPGSGKTRVLVARVAWLLADGHARPHQILAMTFTNKAAREMQERAEALLHTAGYSTQFTAGRNRLWMGTFHSMFARIIRMYAERIGFTSDFSIYDQQDSEQVVKRLMKQGGITSVKPRPVRVIISWAKNRMLKEDQIELRSEVQKVAADLMGPYDKALREANAMDFDDLLLKTYRMLRQHEDVLESCQNRWTHLLIDEFQDTNTLQYRLAQMIARNHGNICVVGDDCQSIYAFRGAEIRNILLFNQDFPKAKIVRLEQNYRSTQYILKLADSAIRHNVGRIDKTLWTSNKKGGRIPVISANSGEAEADKVVDLIQDHMLAHGYRRRDFAILYRTNRLSRQFEDALRKAGIQYRVYGSLSFYQRKEIKDACAYLRLLVNPRDVESFIRAISIPKRGVGAVSRQAVLDFARRFEEGLPYALAHVDEIRIRSAKARRELVKFRELLDRHAERLTQRDSTVRVVESLLKESGLWEETGADITIAAESRIENLHELLGAIEQHVSEQEGTLSSFLQQAQLATSEDESDGRADSVTLMTAHASKGLEFEVVFICGLEEGLFPVTFGEAAQSPRPGSASDRNATARLQPGEVDFEHTDVRRALEAIARLADPSHAARSEAASVRAAARMLEQDGPRAAVNALLDDLGAGRKKHLRLLKDALAGVTADSIKEILQHADAVRLNQDVGRVTRAAAYLDAADSDAYEEERRLFYVAVTRAKSRLYLLWASRRFYAGGVRWGVQSRFVGELDATLVDLHSSGPYRPRHQVRRPRTDIPAGRRAAIRQKPMPAARQTRRVGTKEPVHTGDRVRHSIHGSGTVVRMAETSYGPQATVKFDKSGEKTLVLRYARLTKLT